MKALAFGAGVLLATAVAVVTACGGDAPAASPFPAYTLVPGPTATPLPAGTAPCHESGYCAVFVVGSRALAAAWLDDARMYLADLEGRIRLLDVETGKIETMLEGLSWPRGLTVLDGRLYVSEMGNTCELLDELSSRDDPPGCNTNESNHDMEFLSRVNARILSYGIDQSGTLGDRRVVVDKIIAVNREHSVNGLANDGEYVYVSIGHPQFDLDPQGFFVVNADEIASYGRRTDLMGAIARFRPGDSVDIEVYASGFRNVYGISIAPDGVIYAADNDESHWLMTGEGHLEELNAVVEGGFYGFPLYGTNVAPSDANVIEPMAVLQGVASSYAYANADGVYVGYRYIGGSKSNLVVDRFDYDTWRPQRVFNSDGNITAIMERQGLLYIVAYSGNVHVINPYAAPVKIRAARWFHNDDYVNRVIAQGVPSIIRPEYDVQGYDVHIDERRLIYHKNPCAPADMGTMFFVHIVPVNPDDLPIERRQYGFDNLDFSFSHNGWQSGDTCRAVRELPEYPISEIRTGQYVRLDERYMNIWEAEYDFRR